MVEQKIEIEKGFGFYIETDEEKLNIQRLCMIVDIYKKTIGLAIKKESKQDQLINEVEHNPRKSNSRVRMTSDVIKKIYHYKQMGYSAYEAWKEMNNANIKISDKTVQKYMKLNIDEHGNIN